MINTIPALSPNISLYITLVEYAFTFSSICVRRLFIKACSNSSYSNVLFTLLPNFSTKKLVEIMLSKTNIE